MAEAKEERLDGDQHEGRLEDHLLARKKMNQRLLLSHWTKVP